jgi:hypothetical protein
VSAFSLRHRLAIASAGAAVLGVLLPAAAAQAAPHNPITTAYVPVTGSFVDSGTYLRPGLSLVTGTGTVFGIGGISGANGVPGCVAPNNAPDPGAPCDALVGRIGLNGTRFVVGNSDYIHVPWPGGELYLAVNTPWGGGSFHATVLALS